MRWLEIFPREQLLLVNGDQLIEDPLAQVRRIEDFLGENFSDDYYHCNGIAVSLISHDAHSQCFREREREK